MGVVGSLPSSIPLLSENVPTPIIKEQTLLINEQYDNDMTSISYAIISPPESKSNSIDDIDEQKPVEVKRRKAARYTTVSYGPIDVRVSLRAAPTLQTGRRSKFMPLEGDAAKKRDIRRARNRETARKIKQQRTQVEHQLENEIIQLESRQKDLEQDIRNLQSYKQFLQKRCEEKIISLEKLNETISSNIKCQQENIPTDRRYGQLKTEPRSPSTPWTSYFTI